MDRDIISVSVDAPLEKVYNVITSLEEIKVWEPSHGLPTIRHEWFPSEGIFKTDKVDGRRIYGGFIILPICGLPSCCM